MKYKKIILGVALALVCFSSLNANALTETKVKKTETQDVSGISHLQIQSERCL